jgi:Glycosyltransferase 61
MATSIAELVIIAVLLLAASTAGLRNNKNPAYHLVPDYTENYYYRSLREKFAEVMSINNCTTSGARTGFDAPKGVTPDIHVKVIPPPASVVEIWGNTRVAEMNSTKITFRTNMKLCTSNPFLDFKRGGYKFAKGCEEMIGYDRMGRQFKKVKPYGATLHPMHIRCESKRVATSCTQAAEKPVALTNDLREMHNYPFLITAKQAIVSRGGHLLLPCGPVGLFASCEAVGWGLMNTTASITVNPEVCRKAVAASGPMAVNNCPFPIHDRVFIVTSYDDTQIGQFIQEALPKLVYHLDFVLANPDIKLHFGFTKQLDALPSFVLPHLIFQWLGLSDRLINGTVFAKEVFMPREGGCQDVGYNAWEVVTMRDLFLKKAGVSTIKPGSQRSIVVIRRSASPYTRNQGDYKQRRWPKKELQSMIELLAKTFPQHRVDVYSDLDKKLMLCRECQIRMFYNADVVIAVHGAGLTNTMFMKPGGIVLELVSYFDSRHAPVVGIFPRLSALIGLHHYTFYNGDMSKMKAAEVVDAAAGYAREVGILKA